MFPKTLKTRWMTAGLMGVGLVLGLAASPAAAQRIVIPGPSLPQPVKPVKPIQPPGGGASPTAVAPGDPGKNLPPAPADPRKPDPADPVDPAPADPVKEGEAALVVANAADGMELQVDFLAEEAAKLERLGRLAAGQVTQAEAVADGRGTIILRAAGTALRVGARQRLQVEAGHLYCAIAVMEEAGAREKLVVKLLDLTNEAGASDLAGTCLKLAQQVR